MRDLQIGRRLRGTTVLIITGIVLSRDRISYASGRRVFLKPICPTFRHFMRFWRDIRIESDLYAFNAGCSYARCPVPGLL
jgi:hypothetical protein